MTTLSFSAISLVLPLCRMPAVSTKTYSTPSTTTFSSTASRVVPATGRDDGAILAHQRVEQRRLAHVRPPDDGDLDRLRALPVHCAGPLTGNPAVTWSSRSSTPRRCSAEIGNRSAMPSAVKLVRQRLARGAVDLVHGQRDGRAEPAQQLGQFAVGGGDLGAAVDQEDDVRGAVQRYARLPEDLARDQFGRLGQNAAGVDQLEAPAAVRGLAVDPVARDARLVADDGAALAQDAVEESGLADVGPAHDDNHGQTRSLCHVPS